MATVEKEKEQKQEAADQSGCCGGVAKADLQKEEILGQACSTKIEANPLEVKVVKKEGEQGRSCCG